MTHARERSDAEAGRKQSTSVGKPLAPDTRAFYEQRLGHDFRNVRIHDDAAAHAAAERESARAFTHGTDISFGPNQPGLGTVSGRALLAHELAHVVQQQRGGPEPRRGDAAEAGAQRAAVAIESGGRHSVSGASAVGIARDDKPTTAAHAGGAMGEMDAAFELGKMGFDPILSAGGPAGHKLTEAGFDIVAYNKSTGRLWIVDNKASGGTGTVRDASAITKNLETNLGKAIDIVKGLPQFETKQAVLSKLEATRSAVSGGKPLPMDVELVVTNAGGYHTGIGKSLADKGVKFVDLVGPEIVKTREADMAKARAAGQSTGRPASHEGTAKQADKVAKENAEAAEKLQANAKPSQTNAPATAPKSVTARAKQAAKSGFQTPGSPRLTDKSGYIPPPPPTIGSTRRSKPSYKGAGLADVLPGAMNAFQDLSIRHRVASDMLAQWSEVEKWRRDNPTHWIVGVVSLQEWEQPDPAGMVARTVNYVEFYHGATLADAQAQADNVMRAPVAKGWREVGPFMGEIPPTQSLAECKAKLEDEELCFIATACFGSPLAPQVELLRSYRDEVLRSRAAGRAFARFYYRHSPPVARFLARHRLPRSCVRKCLVPIVHVARFHMEITGRLGTRAFGSPS